MNNSIKVMVGAIGIFRMMHYLSCHRQWMNSVPRSVTYCADFSGGGMDMNELMVIHKASLPPSAELPRIYSSSFMKTASLEIKSLSCGSSWVWLGLFSNTCNILCNNILKQSLIFFCSFQIAKVKWQWWIALIFFCCCFHSFLGYCKIHTCPLSLMGI